MTRTLHQNKQLHALIGQLGISTDIKEGLVYQYTQERTPKSSEMNKQECQWLINELRGRVRDTKDKADHQRKTIISMSYQMGWEIEGGKADMERINNWCNQYGQFKKDFNKHTYQELVQLVTQFRKVVQSFLKDL